MHNNNKMKFGLGTLIGTALLMLSALSLAAPKEQLCHIPPDNPDNFGTISVSKNALSAHLAHGDLSGSCFVNAGEICDDGNACTIDTLDEATGACLHQPVACSDSNSCTNDPCCGGLAADLALISESSVIAESGGEVRITAELSSAKPFPVYVTLDFQGTAVAFVDYVVPFQISIPAGSLSAFVTIRMNDDNVYTGARSIVVNIAAVSPAEIEWSPQSLNIDIVDDELSCADLIIPASTQACTAEDRPVGYDNVDPGYTYICKGTDSDIEPYEFLKLFCNDALLYIGVSVPGKHAAIWPNTPGFDGYLYDCSCQRVE